ncbi:hypothetical protein CCP3SC15_530027 [Gammaproteobacteria bacterium]
MATFRLDERQRGQISEGVKTMKPKKPRIYPDLKFTADPSSKTSWWIINGPIDGFVSCEFE